ncbi:phosphohydrolase [uncultured Agrococcus sp.]|uniref:phosphohydrolase n=1 Tax=uncultured Agrococcus sp. TaxID=382258 RepID=UPI0025F3321F|nr:phosphohydrolase [uncultured Agrococcus sp.]
MENPALSRAILIAARAFDGETDRQGDPYVAHAIRVMHDVEGDDAKIVALLHDTLEWGSLTWSELRAAGFSSRVMGAIDAMTDREGETLSEQVSRIRSNSLALRVKIADIRDNSQKWRTSRMDPETRDQMMSKYRDTAELLGTTLHAIRKRSPELDSLVRRRDVSTVPGGMGDSSSVRKQ